MADETTLYDVKVQYSLDDTATKALGGIQKKADIAAKATSRIDKALKRLIITAAAGLGIKKALEHTVGFNRSLAKTHAQLRTIIQLNTGRSFVESTRASGMLMKQIRIDAKQSAGTMQDMVMFSSAIAGPITRAGGSLKDLREITKGAVVAAAAFGEASQLAQLDIKQALGGTLGARDRFALALLGPMKLTAKEFNKMTAPDRLKTLKQAFNQKGIKDAAKAYQNSFEGVFSTFQSGLQEFGGQVGKKLFSKLTVELGRVNKWFDKNEHRVNDLAESLADGFVTAFQFAKKTFGFIADNKALLMALAKAFLVSRGVNALTGPLAGLGNNLGKFGAKLGTGIAAIGAFAIAAQGVADQLLENQAKQIERTSGSHLAKQQARILGGASQGIDQNTLLGAQRRAKGLGIETFRFLSLEVAKDAKKRGLVDKRGSANINKLAGDFGIEDKGVPGFLLQRAKEGAKGQDPASLALAIEQSNKNANVESLRNLSEFLRGLDKALRFASVADQQRKSFADKQNAVRQQLWLDAQSITNAREAIERNRIFSRDARLRNVSLERVYAEHAGRMVQGVAEVFSGALNPVASFFGLPQVPKASDAKQTDKRSQINVGKIVMNVETNDPDVLAVGLHGLFGDWVRNGVQATGTQRGF